MEGYPCLIEQGKYVKVWFTFRINVMIIRLDSQSETAFPPTK